MANNQNQGGQGKDQGEQRQQQQGGGAHRDDQRRDQQNRQQPQQGDRKPNQIDDEDSDRAGQR
jgi:hypothetical protein